MADVLNAGWLVYMELLNSKQNKIGRLETKYLKDIVAKNLEIFTVEQRTKQ